MDINNLISAGSAFSKLHEHAHEASGIPSILIEAALDTLKMLPLLFLAFLLIEFFEHKAGDKLEAFLKKNSTHIGGAAAGALLGCIPQCSFSVAAANLYSGKIITAGMLIAVFLSTSDEAVPVLLAHPENLGMLWKLLAAKVIIAAAAGIIIDIVLKFLFRNKEEEPDFEDFCSECGCGEHGIWYSSLKHTLKIAVFILLINVALGLVMGLAGEEAVAGWLGKIGVLQPVFSALVGLIPNCAASVLITELYADGIISFGSAVAGLSTGAGLGFAVLFRTNKKMKENFAILGTVYLIGVVSGMVLNAFAL